MNIAHTDLKPGDRFRLTEVEGPDEDDLTRTSVLEGTVTRVDADRVFYGPNDYDYLVTDTENENATWERLAPAEPKNLGAVVEFTTSNGVTYTAVRSTNGEDFAFRYHVGGCLGSFSWEDILAEDANPRVLHEGWDGK